MDIDVKKLIQDFRKVHGEATMTKSKQFIQNYKRDYSNVNVGWNDNGEEVTWYSPWLSPDDALRAVEIEREEMIDKACEWLGKNLSKYSELADKDEYGNKLNEVVMNIFYGQAVNDFKKYMKENEDNKDTSN